MEKLELYLDQVCRSIGGPVEMRDHVRQELREHLLDAVAQHKAAGLSEAEALAMALAEFGKPEEVRSELEATHGQRMIWVIDKALQWKEMTMKAKWLWVSWAYVGLAMVIMLQALFITFNVIFIIPKFKKIMADGLIDQAILNDEGARWMVNYLHELSYIAGHYTLFLLLAPALAWATFEWRVKSENKPFMRLSALGTVAIALTVVVVLMSGSMVVCFCLGMPAMARMARPFALDQVRDVETHLKSWDQLRKVGKFTNEWENAGFREERRADTIAVSNALARLSNGPVLPALTQRNDPGLVNDLRAHLSAAQESLGKAQKAIQARDLKQFELEIDNVRKSFSPILEAAAKTPE
jgi:HAAS